MTFSTPRYLAAALCLLAGAAFANEAPLSPAELSQCAHRVQTLRNDAPRLNLVSERLEARRMQINRRGDNLRAAASGVDRTDLQAGLDLHTRRQQHNAEASAFNAEIEQFKREVNAINALKNDYDRSCAQRPFRRSDLAALPEPTRRAMQMGLADIVVPYLDGAPSIRQLVD